MVLHYMEPKLSSEQKELYSLIEEKGLATVVSFLPPEDLPFPNAALIAETRFLRLVRGLGDALRRSDTGKRTATSRILVPWCDLENSGSSKVIRGPKFPSKILPYRDSILPLINSVPYTQEYRSESGLGPQVYRLYDRDSSPIIRGGSIFVFKGHEDSESQMGLMSLPMTLWFQRLMNKGYILMSSLSESQQYLLRHAILSYNEVNPNLPIMISQERGPRSAVSLPGLTVETAQRSESLRARATIAKTPTAPHGMSFSSARDLKDAGSQNGYGLLSVSSDISIKPEHILTNSKLDAMFNMLAEQGFVTSAQLTILAQDTSVGRIQEGIPYLNKMRVSEHDFIYYVGDRPDQARDKFETWLKKQLLQTGKQCKFDRDTLYYARPSENPFFTNKGVLLVKPQRKGKIPKNGYKKMEYRILTPQQCAILDFFVSKKGVVSQREFTEEFEGYCMANNICDVDMKNAMDIMFNVRTRGRALGYGNPVIVYTDSPSKMWYLSLLNNPAHVVHNKQLELFKQAKRKHDGRWSQLGGVLRNVEVVYNPNDGGEQMMLIRNDKNATIYAISRHEHEFLTSMSRSGSMRLEEIMHIYGVDQNQDKWAFLKSLYFSYDTTPARSARGCILAKLRMEGIVMKQGYPNTFALIPLRDGDDESARILEARIITTTNLLRAEMSTLIQPDGVVGDQRITEFIKGVELINEDGIQRLVDYLNYYQTHIRARGRQLDMGTLANAITSLVVHRLKRQGSYLLDETIPYIYALSQTAWRGKTQDVVQMVSDLAANALELNHVLSADSYKRDHLYLDIMSGAEGEDPDLVFEEVIGGRETKYEEVDLWTSLHEHFSKDPRQIEIVNLLAAGYEVEEVARDLSVAISLVQETKRELWDWLTK